MSTRARILAALLAIAIALLWAMPRPQATSIWEPAFQAFEEQDRNGGLTSGGVLFIGSSTIRLWDLDAAFPTLETVNRGFGGSQFSDAAEALDRIVVPHRPRTVVLYAGDNDIAHYGKLTRDVVADFHAFDDALTHALPETELIVLSIKPSPARWAYQPFMEVTNAKIASYCNDAPRRTYVDLVAPMLTPLGEPNSALYASDGIHLSAEGYALWTETLRPLLTP
jgi:lysophospholipase L1-like esterase